MTRRDRLIINKSEGLRQIKNDLRNMLKEQHTLALADMEDLADEIYGKAQALVPYDTWELQSSIQVDVSRSPRYPGIIAVASAENPKTGYDYALIQEENEDYKHEPGRQAHYLAEPFGEAVQEFFRRRGW